MDKDTKIIDKSDNYSDSEKIDDGQKSIEESKEKS